MLSIRGFGLEELWYGGFETNKVKAYGFWLQCLLNNCLVIIIIINYYYLIFLLF